MSHTPSVENGQGQPLNLLRRTTQRACRLTRIRLLSASVNRYASPRLWIKSPQSWKPSHRSIWPRNGANPEISPMGRSRHSGRSAGEISGSVKPVPSKENRLIGSSEPGCAPAAWARRARHRHSVRRPASGLRGGRHAMLFMERSYSGVRLARASTASSIFCQYGLRKGGSFRLSSA